MYTDIPKSKVYALVDAQGHVVRIEGGYTMGSIEDMLFSSIVVQGVAVKIIKNV